MSTRILLSCTTAIAAAGLAVTAFFEPAAAQKSKDTLRVAVNEPLKSLSPYYFPAREAGFFTRQVFQTLIDLDQRKNKFVPNIASSWKRISPTTLEFKIREGIKFHNGATLDADDVVYTINWAADPKVKMPFKVRFRFIKRAEKVGPNTVRIIAKRPDATDLVSMAFRIHIIDSDTHKAYKSQAEYGRKTPVGTGPYRIIQFDRNKGVIAERFAGYTGDRRAPIKRIHGLPIPDKQSQIAEFLTGNVDVLRNPPKDSANSLASNPKFKITPVKSFTIGYFSLDAVNRSGRKELTDPRVRKAVFMAINRDALRKEIIPGGMVAEKLDALCFRAIQGCGYSTKPVDFDPAAAKKLLAEAGYPNGFDLKLVAFASMRDSGQAIAGYLRKIGIRTDVQVTNTVTTRKLRSGGKIEAYVGLYPGGALPDSSNMLRIFFMAKSRDYWRDPVVHAAVRKGSGMHDDKARRATYAKAFDQINNKHYMLPISSLPILWAHTAQVRIEPQTLNDTETHMSDFFWN